MFYLLSITFIIPTLLIEATGGVYKKQGRSPCPFMRSMYETFLIHELFAKLNPCRVNI
jgi:hypothetical protein